MHEGMRMETQPLTSSLKSRILKVIPFYFIVFKSQVLYLFIFITWKMGKREWRQAICFP
jgi:hypothetical protein